MCSVCDTRRREQGYLDTEPFTLPQQAVSRRSWIVLEMLMLVPVGSPAEL